MHTRRNRHRHGHCANTPAGAVLISVALSGFSANLAAGPTVGELIAVCDRAFAQGYQGLDSATCEWFAAPCACKPGGPGGDESPWCVPDSEPIEATVRKVVAVLRLSPDRESPAEPAVRAALMRLYPCAVPSKPRPIGGDPRLPDAPVAVSRKLGRARLTAADFRRSPSCKKR